MGYDFSKQLFRCSSLGNLMTNQQGKKDTKSLDEISATAIDELIKIFTHSVYGRDKEIKSKYIEKGLAVEEDSITLLSRVHHVIFKKNTERKSNEFITGEVDIIDPLLRDTKSCWDLHTFMAAKAKKLPKDYAWQMMGYCELWKRSSGKISFTLIDTPLGLIEQEKRNLLFKMNAVSSESPEYLKACEALEKEMTFSDIPIEQRLHEVTVYSSKEAMESVYLRAPLWREWLNRFAETPEEKLIEVPSLQSA
jgi:hypothetical protein